MKSVLCFCLLLILILQLSAFPSPSRLVAVDTAAVPPAHYRRDYLDVLGVTEESTSDEIKGAYKALVIKHHPDRSTSQESLEIFRNATYAYQKLTNPSADNAFDTKVISEIDELVQISLNLGSEVVVPIGSSLLKGVGSLLKSGVETGVEYLIKDTRQKEQEKEINRLKVDIEREKLRVYEATSRYETKMKEEFAELTSKYEKILSEQLELKDQWLNALLEKIITLEKELSIARDCNRNMIEIIKTETSIQGGKEVIKKRTESTKLEEMQPNVHDTDKVSFDMDIDKGKREFTGDTKISNYPLESLYEKEMRKLKVVELKAMCKDRGLKVNGKKQDLVDRLLEANLIRH